MAPSTTPSSSAQGPGWLLALLGVLVVASWPRSSRAPDRGSDTSKRVTDNSLEKRHNTKTETESLPGAPAALRAPTTPPRSDSSEDKQVGLQRREWLKRLRKAGAFWIGLSSLLALVAYTVVSRNQWREQIRATGEATKAAETAQRQLEMSERPWLKVAFTFKSQVSRLRMAGCN